MANVCEHCKRSMSSHDNHASCQQCRMAAGECSLDSENPCTTCKVWTRRQWGKLRRSLIDARARSCQRGRQHWSAAFPRLEEWIQSKPASTSASEISSQAGEGDFEEDTLVGTPEQQVMQVLVVQAQNGANMALGTAITAPSTSTTAPSTAPLQVAGPSTIEPIVEQLGQDTPNVIQGARLHSLLKGTAPCRTFPVRSIRHPCRTLRHLCHSIQHLRHLCRTLPHMLICLLCQQDLLLQWVIMVRAISSLLRLTLVG